MKQEKGSMEITIRNLPLSKREATMIALGFKLSEAFRVNFNPKTKEMVLTVILDRADAVALQKGRK